ncbi:hypothetical protein SAMN05216215_1001122 [Saccharopolyspora shandongensis]|uniref:Uncharacterized protein n=1 Tax=Saccharopolyspora shandongensis TaxID=418495 RepID=A0A1H2QK23_9PSEU|nr:hypothetical protein [Saccharopolyspora shandongensis]SDW07240.1 hypothetical protein SAMN05216215_1001122 [Saccharopolyspora shandongensis]
MIAHVLKRQLQSAISHTERLASPVRPLAAPPPGSGLKPVLGDYGLPVIGHTISVLTDLLERILAKRGTGPMPTDGLPIRLQRLS